MTEGAYFEALGSYILVERSGQKVKRIFLSDEPATEPSDLAKEIIAYVEGRVACPEAELDLSGFTDFQREAIAAVQGIPRGRTLTYGEVALLAGRPGAARAVGQVMARNPFLILVPCHRVVARKGLGGFGWGLEAKRRLLEAEGNEMADQKFDPENPLPYGGTTEIHGNILHAITKEEQDAMLAKVRRAFRKKR